jgi:hypothetical protein
MDPTRRVTEADMHVELVAFSRSDGRWEAHVASWQSLSPTCTAADLRTTATDLTTSWSSALWPSVNGPTAVVALDALEAELREVIGSAWRPMVLEEI